MAIDAYTGLPRSGKSYSVVKNVIIPSLKEGREVHTNIPLTDKLKEAHPGQIVQLAADWFSDADLFDKIPAGAVVILDELWRRWPAGMKANNVNFKDKEFLAEHGHNVNEFGHTTRVVLVSQDLSQIAAFARDLVSVTYRSTKLDAVGAGSRFRVDIYSGAVTGQKPPKSQLNRSVFDKYEPEFYEFYKSSTKSQTGDVGDESRADKRNNIWKSPFILFSFIAPVLCIPFLAWYLYGLFFGGLGLVDAPEPEPVPTFAIANPPPPDMRTVQSLPASQTVNPPPPPEPPKPQLSSQWRIAGYMLRGKDQTDDSRFTRELIVLSSEVAGLRYMLASGCERFPDGINWKCEVDGQIATAWTGRGSFSDWSSTSGLVTRTASVASGATDGTSPSITNPPPTGSL